MVQKRVDCFKCKSLYVTWDQRFPYGCKAMGFKSKNIPSVEVYKASGMNCQKFAAKS